MARRSDAPPRHSTEPQAGVVPYRVRSNGLVQVLLITNRGGDWILPKGKIGSGHTPRAAARTEAMEEAGVIGTPARAKIGHYEYKKLGRWCRVALYPMPVDRVLNTWPEKKDRDRVWVSVREAVRRVAFAELRDVIERFGKLQRRGAA